MRKTINNALVQTIRCFLYSICKKWFSTEHRFCQNLHSVNFVPFIRFASAAKMPRRNRISLEHRERIVREFEDKEEDYLVVADTLGVNRSTARCIVARYIREGRIQERPRGGRNIVRVDEEMRDCLEKIINENCLLTLARINSELRRRLPLKPQIHDRTVARTLDGMLFRVKVARPLLAVRNRPDVMNKRVDYATWFMNHAVVRHCVFVDECGYNIWTARSHGRVRQGERAYRQVCDEDETWLWQWQFRRSMDLCFPQQLLAESMLRVLITSWHRRGQI